MRTHLIAMICLTVLAAASLSANGEKESAPSAVQAGSSGSHHILVLYFDQGMNSKGASGEVDAISSASLDGYHSEDLPVNNIRVMKDEIIQKTGGDEFAVMVNEQYDPDYRAMVDGAREEQRENRQFTFKNDLPDISGYDTIFVGAPVWWSNLPQPMVNVFDKLDFSGKTIIPFGIHRGSRFGNMVNQMRQLEPNATVSGDGLTLDARTANSETRSQVDDWLEKLGY